MGKRKELSQAEVWDDSALLRSWDEALEEYKVCTHGLLKDIYCKLTLIVHSYITAYMPAARK